MKIDSGTLGGGDMAMRLRAGRGRRRWLRPGTAVVAVAASVAVGLLAGVPTSQAITPGITGYQVVTGPAEAFPSGADTLVNDGVSCPSGQTAVGGGISAHSPLTLLVASYPSSASTWAVSAELNNTLGYTEHFTPYAVCVDTSSVPGVHIASATTSVSKTNVNPSSGVAGLGIVDVFCNTGEYVLGGGYLSASSRMLPSISRWLDGDTRAWQAAAYNTDSSFDNNLTAYAVCVPQGDVTDYVQQHGDSSSFGVYLNQPVAGSATAGSNTSGAPYCPNGDLAVGGGVVNHDNQSGNAFISSLIPAPGGDPHYWNETSTDLNPPSYGEWAAGYDVCVNGSVEPTVLPTTTTLSIAPTSPALNQTATLTATVSPHPGPTGTVTFYDNGVAIGTGTVGSNGVATLTTTFGGGSHSLVATYGGDSNYSGSSSVPVTFTIACTTTITGTHSSFNATSGLTCVTNAHITGGINVVSGAKLDLENTVVSGSVSSSSSGDLRICGSTVSSITVSGSTGFVRIGDPANNCAANVITGGLTAVNNTGGGAVVGNTIGGSWTIAGNNPAFTVSGNHH